MQPLNVKVEADPATLRQTSDWLGKVGGPLHDSGTDVRSASGKSEGDWKGHAGDAFRNAMDKTGPAIDRVATHFRGLREALNQHADDIDTVKSRMSQARGIANQAGLEVTDAQIMPPGPAPARPQPLPVDRPCTMADRQEHQDAVAAQQVYSRKVAGYLKCADVVHGARKIETDAQDKLLNVAGKVVGSDPFSIAKTIAGIGGSTVAQSSAYRAAANWWASRAEYWASKLATGISVDDPAWRTAMYNHAVAKIEAAENLNKAQATRLARAVDKLPNWAKNGLTTTLGQKLDVPSNPILGRAVRMLQAIPVLNFGLTSASVALNIGAGNGVARSAASGYSGFGAGLVATTLMSNPYGWAAIGVGSAVSLGVGTLVDEMFEAGQDPDGLRQEQLDATEKFAEYEQWRESNRAGAAAGIGETVQNVETAHKGTNSDSADPLMPGFLGRLIG